MNGQPLFAPDPMTKVTMRDVLTPLFRRGRLVILVFSGILLGTLLFSVLWAGRYYEAKMQVLVEQNRSDPAITSVQNAAVMSRVITPDEISSEIALLSGHDILLEVADVCSLASNRSLGDVFLPRDPTRRNAAKLEKAAVSLAKALDVEAEKTSDVINVSYGSTNSPETPLCVLSTLAKLYVQKHLELQRPKGSSQFFTEQTDRYQKKLAEAEAQLVDFGRDKGIAAPDVVRQSMAQQLASSIASLYQTQELIAADQRRIADIRSQMKVTPARSSSQQVTAPANTLLQDLAASLLQAQTKRTLLALKYDPSYPLVQEADHEVAETRAAIAEAKKAQYVTESTDRDETFELLRQELAKSQADLAAHLATAAALEQSNKQMQAKVVNLDEMTIKQSALLREAKADETTYLLYLDKREQQRVADALDRERIANVAIAVPPVAPALPAHSPLLIAFVGFVLATVVSVGSGYFAEYLDPTFRVPAEVSGLLDIPVLASLPKLKA